MADDEEIEISWRAVRSGMPVQAADGTPVGRVIHVLGDPEEDIFDGVGVHVREREPYRMVSWRQVERMTERAVYLRISVVEVEQAPLYQEEHVYQLGVTGFFRHHLGWREANRR